MFSRGEGDLKKPANFPLGAAAAPSTGTAAVTRGGGGGGGGVDISGDSPELIAFVLLKSIVQVEQSRQQPHVFEKDWLLDTYAECLDAVHGKRTPSAPDAAKRGAKKA
jgi:hypothetical protein